MFKKIKDTVASIRGETRSVLREEVCPFCFDEFRLKDTPFRCASPPERCSPEPDPVWINVWKENKPVGKVISSTGQFKLYSICPTCNQRTHKRLCPHCHQELPPTFGEFRNYIFSVIGAKGAGKSHYIPALLEQIKHRIGRPMGILIKPVGDFTINRYRNDFYNPLYRDHKVIATTQSGMKHSTIQLPMVFTLTFTGTNLIRQDTIKNAITLVFFDTAGEDLQSEDTLNYVNKYIYRSDGIILLLDPLQLNKVRDRLNSSLPLPPQDTDTTDIISRVTSLIRQGRNWKSTSKIDIPLAIALSKMDAVKPLMPENNYFAQENKIEKYFDSDNFNQINQEMQTLIEEWGSDYLIHQLTTEFKRFGFFGLTALGKPPSAKGEVLDIEPYRVEDPFLWLLNQHGLLKSKPNW